MILVFQCAFFFLLFQIERIQNPSLYQKYSVHKVHMDKSNPPNVQNERELWHGTSADALDEIHATGFNRGFCGRNGMNILNSIFITKTDHFSTFNI